MTLRRRFRIVNREIASVFHCEWSSPADTALENWSAASLWYLLLKTKTIPAEKAMLRRRVRKQPVKSGSPHLVLKSDQRTITPVCPCSATNFSVTVRVRPTVKGGPWSYCKTHLSSACPHAPLIHKSTLSVLPRTRHEPDVEISVDISNSATRYLNLSNSNFIFIIIILSNKLRS